MNNIIAKTASGGKRNTMPLIDLTIDDEDNNPNIDSITTNQTAQPLASPISNGIHLDDRGVYLRAKLRFYFMSPCWKWHLKRQCPWKAWFQFVKIFIVTTQLILFGIERETHIIFVSESNITFHHLFVRDWSSSLETLPYPRASGDFALYTTQDFMDSINYAVHRFNNLTDISVGLFDFHENPLPKPSNITVNNNDLFIKLCMNRFKTCQIDPTTHSYKLDPDIVDVCFTFNATNDFDIEKYLLNQHNTTINYCGLNTLTLNFNIHAVQLKNQKPFSLPDCYHFSVTITFDNNARTGKIRQHLNSEAKLRPCQQTIVNKKSGWLLVRRDGLIIYDFIVIFISIISCILCIRSLRFGHRLCKEVRLYYSSKRLHENPLKWSDLQIFYSFWYFLMIITDLMVIPGSILKIGILFKTMDNYNAAGVLLGLSSLFSWISILRYLTFFRKYNLLFVTFKNALPLLLRFIVCACIIYCGFMFCGWIVLGPYHSKFRTLLTTFETMFGLINGDDMYTTFANLETESIYIRLFSELYLYSFSCLFVYVISSLIIALIIDGYDTVKKYYTDGFPKNRLQKFSEEEIPQWSGTQDWQDLTTAVEARSVCFPCCFKTNMK